MASPAGRLTAVHVTGKTVTKTITTVVNANPGGAPRP